jgi:hypothetical protein
MTPERDSEESACLKQGIGIFQSQSLDYILVSKLHNGKFLKLDPIEFAGKR